MVLDSGEQESGERNSFSKSRAVLRRHRRLYLNSLMFDSGCGEGFQQLFVAHAVMRAV